MSWETVLSNIAFWQTGDTWGGPFVFGSGQEFSDTQKDEILTAIHQLYVLSPAAASVLEDGTGLLPDGTRRTIRIYQTTEGVPGVAPVQGTIGLNLTSIDQTYYISPDGQLVQSGRPTIIIHELFHAIRNLPDTTPNDPTDAQMNAATFDHLGQVLPLQNIVIDEMGLTAIKQQVSYHAAMLGSDPRFATLKTNISYTEGAVIDIAYFGDRPLGAAATNTLDTSGRSTSKDLTFGFANNDTISTGGGSDYAYGGTGDDTISGGSGNDVIHGGDRKTTIPNDGEDTADYSVGDNGAAPGHGITVNIDPAAVGGSETIEGVTPIIVSDDGYGGRDRLFSIEKLKLSDHADIVKVGANSSALLSPLKEIDAGGQASGTNDVLDFSSYGTPVTIIDGKLSGTGVKFKNFEAAVGASGDDRIQLGGTADPWFYSGDGNDVLQAGPAADVLEGGEGVDLLSGGAGADIFIVGLGGDLILDADSADRLFIRLSTIDGSDAEFGANADKVVPIKGGFFLNGAWDPDEARSFSAGDDAHFIPVRWIMDQFDDPATLLASIGTDYSLQFSLANGGADLQIVVKADGQTSGIIVKDYHAGDLGLTFPTIVDPRQIDGEEEWYNEHEPGWEAAHQAMLDGGQFADLDTIADVRAPDEGDGPPTQGDDGDDNFQGDEDNDIFYSGNGNDSVNAGNGNDTVRAGRGNDTVNGGAGNDRIYGDAGNDTITGGPGMDVIEGGEGGDTASYAAATAGVVVDLTTGTVSGADIGSDALVSIENAVGGSGDDQIAGNAADNALTGGGGNDTMTGGLGNDTFYVDSAGDVVNEAAGEGDDRVWTSVSYALASGLSIETFTTTDHSGTSAIDLTGNATVQLIVGNDGNNIIDGEGGADTMLGRLGNDQFYVDNAGDVVSDLAGQGDDRVWTSVSYALNSGSEIETFTTTDHFGTAAINLTGNATGQFIAGNDGNNIIDGQGGADTMLGRLGNDQVYVDNAGDVVNEAAGQGDDRVWTSVSYALGSGAEIETFTTDHHTGTSAINLTGNAFGQFIMGNDGDNIINGAAGIDTMVGRLGNDQFYVDHAGDVATESAGQGSDRVWTSVSYALTAGSEIETFTTDNHTGTGAINLTGNATGQFIMGNDGANIVNGGGGADTLVSRAGSDVYLFNSALGPSNIDTLTDFNLGLDIFNIDDAVFAGLPTGTLAAGAFFIGSAAHDADDRIVYNNQTGALVFDPDGSGAAAAQQFAAIGAGFGIDHSYFIVV